jgi:isopenicillin N synthase-like dioxygenase
MDMEGASSTFQPQHSADLGETTAMADVVVIDWKDLVACRDDFLFEEGTGADADSVDSSSTKLPDALRKSLGRDSTGTCCDHSDRSCIGLIAIRGVPGFVEAKARLFGMAHSLVSLPPEVLEGELSDPSSLYNAGWSFGKEKMGNEPDTAKGSYYYNPVTDVPGTDQDREMYPLSYPVNVWPSEELMPGFRPAAKDLGNILFGVVVQVARHVDALAISTLPDSYTKDLLHASLKDTDKVKARLLYYFPMTTVEEEATKTKEDSWIAWHNDSGFFTALAGDMYVQHSTGQPITGSMNLSDPNAGLYVESRSGRVLKATVPDDCVAVQIGECTQIVTGGAVRATPHCVRGSAVPDVARVSLAVFVDTVPAFPLVAPPGCDVERDVLLLPPPSSTADDEAKIEPGGQKGRVPPLSERWTRPGMPFGEFLSATFQKYYDWTTKTAT